MLLAPSVYGLFNLNRRSDEVLLAEDVDVVVRVGGGRNKREEITEILGTSDFVELTGVDHDLSGPDLM